MSVFDLLATLAAQGIEFWTEGGKLRFRAPKGALTPELRARLTEQKDEILAAVIDRASQTVTTLPLSYSQLGLWLIHQIAPHSAAYNVSFSARICSEIDLSALQAAFQAIVDRHATLRTVYTMQDGRPVQQVYGYAPMDFEQLFVPDLTDDALHRQVTAAYEQPFDLENGPVIRVRLFTRAPGNHILLLVVHHVALDGWSMWLLLDEFRALYPAYTSGESAALPRPEADYPDFVRWQANLLDGSEGDKLWLYWQQQLSGELPTLNLMGDHVRPLMPSYRGGSQVFMLDADTTRGLKELAKAEGVTLYMVLLAAWQTLLHRYTGQEDIITGTPTFGRTLAEHAKIIGHFINMIPMRTTLVNNPPFRDFLALVRQTVLTALEYQEFPFALMVERLGGHQDGSRSPIFQSSFDVQRVHQFAALSDLFVPIKTSARVDLGGLEIEAYPMPQQEGQFDLGIQILETADALSGVLKFNGDIFEPATIERMADHYQMLLHGIASNPGQRVSELPLLTDAERHQLLVEWNDTHHDYPLDTPVHRLFEAQVERAPDAAAVRFEQETLTYAELNRRANQLAHYLRAQGVKPDMPVGIYVERSAAMVVGLLGILKAGGAYVPLDPALPGERLGMMIADTAMPVIVTQASLVDALPAYQARVVCYDADAALLSRQPDTNPPNVTMGNHLAYVIFTSGSTGRPKGVQIEHRGFTNFLLTMAEQPGMTVADVTLAITTLSFDISTLEIFLPLVVGGQVAVATRDMAMDGSQIGIAVEHYGVTVLQATPVTWRLLLEAGWTGRAGLKMLAGGEPVTRELARQLLTRGAELWDVYGPTEATVWCTVDRLTAEDEVISIGRPIANMTAYVLDEHMQPVPVGVPGVLWLGGVGVARGYLNRPELTVERFVPDPFSTTPGARMYNSGDLARYLPDGRLECLGRTDNQVKVRGFRIELGEIEALLAEHAGVQKNVVVAREDTPGDKRLVAYYVPTVGSAPGAAELREHLKTKLPVYMIPSAFVELSTFPTTPSGKIDRRALPAPDQTRQETVQPVAAPQTPTENLLAVIWKDVLQINEVSLYDNFFDLGGHSLQAMQAITKAEAQTGLKIEPAVMRFQTLGQLAAAYDELQAVPPVLESDAESGLPQKLFTGIRRLVSKKK